MSDDTRPVQPGHAPAPLRGRRWIPVTAVAGGVIVTGLLVGGTALAQTTSAPTPSTTAPSPTPPTDGTTPTPPADGGPRGGHHGGPGGGGPEAAVVDGSTRSVGTTTAVDGSSVTVHTDAGQDVTATLGSSTRYRTTEPTPPAAGSKPVAPAQGSASDLATGQRVEVTVKDGAALEVGIVRAHVDGTVLDTSGGSATVVTRDGLHVRLDLSATKDGVTVGQHVRATGTASADGASVLVSSVSTATR